MDKIEIIEFVNRLFIAVDERNWQEVSDIFNDNVLLDYTSMAGGEPVNLTAVQIIDSWKNVLPGFDRTHHQLGNFRISDEPDIIRVFCYGTATHYLKNDSGDNVWTVVGTYDLELQYINARLKVTAMKFNLKYTDGNNDLPAIAQNRLKNVNSED